ncbi:MAG: ABC transporter permease subunit [Chloroflexi bacterium]|nr:ABC transporter permease subunit [Chloroflexota bacterium]
MPLLIISKLTLVEMGRRRVFLAVAILTLLIILFTGWGFQRLLTLPCGNRPCSQTTLLAISSTLTIMIMFMFSFIITLGAAFLAAPAIATDIESGIALSMLPRPVRRSDILLGKWLALAGLIVFYTVAVGVLEFAVIRLFTGYVPPQPVKSIIYMAAEGVTLLTLALLGSTRLGPLTSGISAVLVFGITWMAGVAESVGLAINNTAITNVGVIISLIVPSDGLWRGAMFHLEPAIILATATAFASQGIGNPFVAASPPTPAYIIWAVLWVVLMLGLAAYSFQKRDL